MDLKATDTMIIDASLLRAQRMYMNCEQTDELHIETAYLCICCRGVYAENVGRCPKDGRNVLPFARLALPVIGGGEVFFADDPTLPVDAVGLMHLDDVYETERTHSFTKGLDLADDELLCVEQG